MRKVEKSGVSGKLRQWAAKHDITKVLLGGRRPGGRAQGSSFNNMDVVALCDASTEGDAKAVRKLLVKPPPTPAQVQAPTGPDDPLLPSPAECRSLHDLLFGSATNGSLSGEGGYGHGGVGEELSAGVKRRRPSSTSCADSDEASKGKQEGDAAAEPFPRTGNMALPTKEEDRIALVRALLMIPGTTYVTPWEAVMCAVSAIQAGSGIFGQQQEQESVPAHVEGKVTMEEAVMAEIGIFMGTAGYYPRRRALPKADQSNNGTAGCDERTQRALLRRLANLIVAPLILEKDDESVDEDDACLGETGEGGGPNRTRITAALGLLPAIFDAAKRMDRGSAGGEGAAKLIPSVLDRLVPPRTGNANISSGEIGGNESNSNSGMKPTMVALLLPILVSLGPHVSQQRWLDARALISRTVEYIPHADLPLIAKEVVNQIISNKSGDREAPMQAKSENSDETAPSTDETKSPSSSWYKLLLQLYQQSAGGDPSSFGVASQATNTAATLLILSAFEQSLSKTFATMASTSLILLADEIRDAATWSDEADTCTPQWVASSMILLIGATGGSNESKTVRTVVDRAISGRISTSSLGRRRRRGASATPAGSYALDILLEFAEVENLLLGENQQQRRLTLSDLRCYLTKPMTKSNHGPYEKIAQRLENFVAQGVFLGDRLSCKSCGNCVDGVIETHVGRYLDFANGILAHFDSNASTSLAEHQVVLRVCFALAIYSVVFERVPGLRQDVLLSLARGLCHNDSSGNMHYDLALFALSLKAQGGNERAVGGEGSVDTDAATDVSECFDGLVDIFSGKRTFGKFSEVAHNPEPLSMYALRTLAQVLCAVSSEGRQAIFNAALQLLSSTIRSTDTDTLPPYLLSVARGPDAAAPLAIDLLCLLLRPTGRKVFARDLYCISSLARLCNMMVLDALPLTLAVRRSLYSHICDLAKEEEFDAWTCARFERASICALLNHFGSISDPDGLGNKDGNCTTKLVFLPQASFSSWSRPALDSDSKRRTVHVNQVDDISLLLDLTVTLRSARLGDHRKLSKNLVEVIGKGACPAILDCSPTAEETSTRGGSSQEVDNLIEQILSHCLGAIAQIIFSLESQDDEISGQCGWQPCTSLQKRICGEEIAIFKAVETAHAAATTTTTTTTAATKQPLCPPMWLECNESRASQMTNTHRSIISDSIKPALCSTIFSIVLGGGSPTADDSEYALNLAISFNKIIHMTSRIPTGRDRNEESAPILIDDLSTRLVKNARPYFEASTLALRRLLDAKSTTNGSSTNEKHLYVVLKGLERCCHCIENIERYDLPHAFKAKQTIASLWDVYLEVGGEDGACRLIRYLDERLMRAKGVGVSDLAIESHEDIDELVRSVRIVILTSLASLAKYSRRRLDPNDSNVSLAELLAKISSLTSDLYTGLDGKSGGITRNVFMAYLTAIDTCVDSLLFMDYDLIWKEFSSGTADLTRAQALIEASSIHLWNIPCKFCLDQEARTFKTTLDMALSGLQSIRRHIDFVLVFAGDTTSTNSQIRIGGSQSACHSLSCASDQCVVALRAASKSLKQPSRKVIDDDSTSDGDASSDDDDASSDEYESDNNIESTLKSPEDSAAFKTSAVVLPKALRRLQVNTPNAWTWTQTAVFVAVETNWAESQSIIKAKNLGAREHSSQMLLAYVACRHQDLSSALKSVTSFLETVRHATSTSNEKKEGSSLSRRDESEDEEHEFDDREEQTNGKLLSELLSPTTKLKLCSTLDRVTTTLRAALRTISAMLRDVKNEGKDIESTLSLRNSIQFGESLACLYAWFTCSRNGRALLTSGARRWFHNEKARYRVAKAKAKAGGYHLDQDPILSRLPKVLYQMEEMEVSFQKFAAMVLSPSKKKNSKACQIFLADVDALLPSFTTSANTTTGTLPSGEESKSFATIVAEHRDRLASSSDSKLSSFDMALISFKDKEDELGNPTLGKRKRRGRNNAIEKHLRKAQRNVLRSRNEVVDEWLDLDADNADRNDTMDAFVDLEDFLVEG